MIREKRDSRLTADISETAHDLLRTAVIKFDSSKGKLVEKMIHNFLGGDIAEGSIASVALEKIDKPKAPKAPRKQISYPSNLDEQFLLLWDTKGKKGKKQGAYDIYRKMSAGQTDDVLEAFTLILINDINKNKHEAGYPERHLTSYLNGKFWEE